MEVIFEFFEPPEGSEIGDIVGSFQFHLEQCTGLKSLVGVSEFRPDGRNNYYVVPRTQAQDACYVVELRNDFDVAVYEFAITPQKNDIIESFFFRIRKKHPGT